MKIVKKIKILSIILLLVIVVFTLLGSFKLYEFKEGACTGVSCEDVPKCSNSLDEDESSNNWFIKSSLVPPVCTTCPYYNDTSLKASNDKSSTTLSSSLSDSKKDKSSVNTSVGNFSAGNKGDDNRVTTNLSQTSDYYNKEINATNTTNQNDNSVKQDNSNKQNITQDNSVNQDFSQSESAESKFNNLLGGNSIMFGSFGGGGANSNTINSPNNVNNNRSNSSRLNSDFESGLLPVSTPAKASNNSVAPYQENNGQGSGLFNNFRGNNNQKNNSNGECPPCPACERCPEPAFECKKVPNYRSPQIDNYMPVPILNDFSNF